MQAGADREMKGMIMRKQWKTTTGEASDTAWLIYDILKKARKQILRDDTLYVSFNADLMLTVSEKFGDRDGWLVYRPNDEIDHALWAFHRLLNRELVA